MEAITFGKLKLKPEVMLICLHCRNEFPVKDLKPEPWFDHQGCPFCGAAGYGVDIFRRNSSFGRGIAGEEPKRRAKKRVRRASSSC